MLTLTNIRKTFGAGTVNEKTALAGVDLHLDKGDFVTVLGSNGAGKSTLFGAIAGTFLPDSGSILLDGQNITNLPDYKRSKFIGRLFQDPLKGTAPNMTIEENLAKEMDDDIELLGWTLNIIAYILRNTEFDAESRERELPAEIAAYVDRNFKEDITIK